MHAQVLGARGKSAKHCLLGVSSDNCASHLCETSRAATPTAFTRITVQRRSLKLLRPRTESCSNPQAVPRHTFPIPEVYAPPYCLVSHPLASLFVSSIFAHDIVSASSTSDSRLLLKVARSPARLSIAQNLRCAPPLPLVHFH